LNLNDFAQGFADAQIVLEVAAYYNYIHDTLSKYLDLIIAHPQKINQIAGVDKKTV